MSLKLNKINKLPEKGSIIVLGNKKSNYSGYGLDKKELDYVKKAMKDEEKQFMFNHYDHYIYVDVVEEEKDADKLREKTRVKASKLIGKINKNKEKSLALIDAGAGADVTLAFTEGLALANYQFLKYFTKEVDKKRNSLAELSVYCEKLDKNELGLMQIACEATAISRDLVNEPLSYLTAPQFAKELQKLSKEAGYSIEVLQKKQIESLKMGGLLAVNKGSVDPPTFSILSWKPEKAVNKKPIVLVGKGIVYDTGGLSLKPTPYMDTMKSDMGGAAAVAGAMYAISKAKLPLHIIGLIPATDNRPDGNAYAPGDVIQMHNGMTVEVLNTDAEGRMILADALSYAQKYKPELVIDLATLTGAAAVAFGDIAMAGMGTAGEKTMKKLIKSGFRTHERIVELPFWDDYKDMLKSSIADIKNIGGRDAGAITAGKFLEYFTDYPYVHLDIAGPAFLKKDDNYRKAGGTGVGVRLLFDFFRNYKS